MGMLGHRYDLPSPSPAPGDTEEIRVNTDSSIRVRLILAAIACVMPVPGDALHAQAYPSRTVELLGDATGIGPEISARLPAAKMAASPSLPCADTL